MSVNLIKTQDTKRNLFADRDNVQGAKAGWLVLQQQMFTALDLYQSHAYGYLDDMDIHAFAPTLCKDAWNAKQNLRQMLRQSKYWDEDLQCCVIPSCRHLAPNLDRAEDIAEHMLYQTGLPICDCKSIAKYIAGCPGNLDWYNERYPGTVHKGMKPTKLLVRILKQHKVDTSSYWVQSEISRLGEELYPRDKKVTLYLSINPSHFMTMSNPKGDERGRMLTSCHSLDTDDLTYNNGCAGYARDNITMILFQAATDDIEGRCTRKVLRQLFMYEPGSEILLQSRLYDANGGTRGPQEASDWLREVVTDVLNECEHSSESWNAHKYLGRYWGFEFKSGMGFGGYADWGYSDFDPIIAFRGADKSRRTDPFFVGTHGICLSCGDYTEPNDGIYCDYCNPCQRCDQCGESIGSADESYVAYDRHGHEITVCQDCLYDGFTYCNHCGDYHDSDNCTETIDGEYVCNSCLERYYYVCDECGRAVRGEDVLYGMRWGDEQTLCPECAEDSYVLLADGTLIHYNEPFHDCPGCGEFVAGNDESEPCEDCKTELEG